jgi:hypothetical protein
MVVTYVEVYFFVATLRGELFLECPAKAVLQYRGEDFRASYQGTGFSRAVKA